ncbi:hypothetical protein RB195_011236 [Necator americanus]|uniref:VWFA domain-containing protein n=1 Tax=Necator americanus TaxID=51031 RepID=A0ABR1D4T2_NECAM
MSAYERARVKSHYCEDSELSLYDKCIVVKNYGEFSLDACGDSHKLHTIEHRDELKWITVLLELSVPEVWIANKDEDAELLNPRFEKGRGRENATDLRATLHIQGDSFGSYLRGTTFYAETSKKLPYLCSRSAMAFESTIRDIFNVITTLGFQSEMGKDRTGAPRPFSFLPLMMAVRGSKFDPQLQELHQACQLLPNGYAASLYDFYNKEGFSAIRAKFPDGLCRTTIGRIPSFSVDPEPSCVHNKEEYKANRKRWTYYGPGNFTALSNEAYWEEKYPSNLCADLPRTTAGLLQSYVDIPAIARRPILCTYGNPPSVIPLKLDDQCNKAAHFDHAKQRCVCNNPEKDGKVIDPKKYAKFPEGIVCIDCVNTTVVRSIVFVLDDSGTVKNEGWLEQKKFMVKVTELIKNIRVGIVVIAGTPTVEVDIDFYENNKGKIKNFLETKEWGNKWTSIGPALYLARKSLENEETKERIIVLISDGDADFCPYDDPFDKCPPEAKRNLIAHSQEKEADEIYKRKIRVIFALVGTLYKGSDAAIARVNHIAKSPENIVPVASFTSFDTSVLDNMIYTICKEQH